MDSTTRHCERCRQEGANPMQPCEKNGRCKGCYNRIRREKRKLRDAGGDADESLSQPVRKFRIKKTPSTTTTSTRKCRYCDYMIAPVQRERRGDFTVHVDHCCHDCHIYHTRPNGGGLSLHDKKCLEYNCNLRGKEAAPRIVASSDDEGLGPCPNGCGRMLRPGIFDLKTFRPHCCQLCTKTLHSSERRHTYECLAHEPTAAEPARIAERLAADALAEPATIDGCSTSGCKQLRDTTRPAVVGSVFTFCCELCEQTQGARHGQACKSFNERKTSDAAAVAAGKTLLCKCFRIRHPDLATCCKNCGWKFNSHSMRCDDPPPGSEAARRIRAPIHEGGYHCFGCADTKSGHSPECDIVFGVVPPAASIAVVPPPLATTTTTMARLPPKAPPVAPVAVPPKAAPSRCAGGNSTCYLYATAPSPYCCDKCNDDEQQQHVFIECAGYWAVCEEIHDITMALTGREKYVYEALYDERMWIEPDLCNLLMQRVMTEKRSLAEVVRRQIQSDEAKAVSAGTIPPRQPGEVLCSKGCSRLRGGAGRRSCCLGCPDYHTADCDQAAKALGVYVDVRTRHIISSRDRDRLDVEEENAAAAERL